jgi:hypothetical protein
MPCSSPLPGVIVCTRGGGKRCKCGAAAPFLCDHPKGGKTCDAPLCAKCARTVGPEQHRCHAHWVELQGKAGKAPVTFLARNKQGGTPDPREEYEDTAVTVLRVTPKAVRVDYEGNEAWVPLSLCDERTRELGAEDEGEEREIGIRLWKVEELGWL